jgi:hypothetical protein
MGNLQTLTIKPIELLASFGSSLRKLLFFFQIEHHHTHIPAVIETTLSSPFRRPLIKNLAKLPSEVQINALNYLLVFYKELLLMH